MLFMIILDLVLFVAPQIYTYAGYLILSNKAFTNTIYEVLV